MQSTPPLGPDEVYPVEPPPVDAQMSAATSAIRAVLPLALGAPVEQDAAAEA